jgi:membrane protease YdiL (CAAX protease family)
MPRTTTTANRRTDRPRPEESIEVIRDMEDRSVSDSAEIGSAPMESSVRPTAAGFIGVAVLVTGVSSYLAFSPDRSGTLAFWVLAVVPGVVLAAAAAVWARREDLLREWLSPTWGDFTRGVLGAVAMFGVAWALSHLVTPVGSKREIWLVSLYGQIGSPRALLAHAPAVAAAVVLAAVAEEILWRGAVTQLLAERVGSRAAWVWAAGLYSISFAPTAWALRAGGGLNPVLVVVAAGGGLFWGALARAFGRLVPGILTHALFDWAVIMMFPLWGPR